VKELIFMPRKFPDEFRDDVVRAFRERGGEPVARVARDFGISEACLHRWLKLADGAASGVPVESEELRKIKKRNSVLEQENEILRRAAAFFAKDCSPK
jgi:transposase